MSGVMVIGILWIAFLVVAYRVVRRHPRAREWIRFHRTK